MYSYYKIKNKGWNLTIPGQILDEHNKELDDKELPWAQVLNPPGNSGSQNTGETIRLAQGDVVV